MFHTARTILLFGVVAASLHAQPLGNWKISASAPDGLTYDATLSVVESDGKLAVSVQRPGAGAVTIPNATFQNGELRFRLPSEKVRYVDLKLKAANSQLTGTLETPEGETGTITGTRVDTASEAPPAAGTWKLVAKTSGGRQIDYILQLTANGKQWTGRIGPTDGDSVALTGIAAQGSQIQFTVPTGDGDYGVTGTVEGKQMQGTYKAPDGSTGTFTASKP